MTSPPGSGGFRYTRSGKRRILGSAPCRVRRGVYPVILFSIFHVKQTLSKSAHRRQSASPRALQLSFDRSGWVSMSPPLNGSSLPNWPLVVASGTDRPCLQQQLSPPAGSRVRRLRSDLPVPFRVVRSRPHGARFFQTRFSPVATTTAVDRPLKGNCRVDGRMGLADDLAF